MFDGAVARVAKDVRLNRDSTIRFAKTIHFNNLCRIRCVARARFERSEGCCFSFNLIGTIENEEGWEKVERGALKLTYPQLPEGVPYEAKLIDLITPPPGAQPR